MNILRDMATYSKDEIMQGFSGAGNVVVEGNVGRMCNKNMAVWSNMDLELCTYVMEAQLP